MKYARVIKGILDRLSYIASYDQGSVDLVMRLTEKERKIIKAVVEGFDKSK